MSCREMSGCHDVHYWQGRQVSTAEKAAAQRKGLSPWHRLSETMQMSLALLSRIVPALQLGATGARWWACCCRQTVASTDCGLATPASTETDSALRCSKEQQELAAERAAVKQERAALDRMRNEFEAELQQARGEMQRAQDALQGGQ